MMKQLKVCLLIALVMGGMNGSAAEVCRISEPVTVDGKLDEPCWSKTAWEGGFAKFENVVKDREVTAKTEFALLADERAVYLGVKCYEPDMEAVRAMPPASLWSGNTVEFFFAPSGSAFDFYHFAVGYAESSGVYSDFASEGGNIHPDPYKPEWQVARGEFDGGWTLEIALPLAAFYMNRNAHWTEEWLVNVCRNRLVKSNRELTSWSPLFSGFAEPKRFRKMKGFPKRRAADDVAMLDLNAAIGGREGDRLTGTASLKIHVAEAGEYELSSPNLETTALSLTVGDNRVKAGCSFTGNGRHLVPLALKRVKTGETYRREYPVPVDFREIAVKLTLPQYRDNFYPGQCADRVKGRVNAAFKGGVKVTLEGEGFPRREVTLPEGGGEIDFDTTGFKQGSAAVLRVEKANGERVDDFTLTIRNLAPTGRRMAWIEDGRLIVDGRPTLRRGIYAQGYMGGAAFDEKFKADEGLCMTTEVVGGGTLEPERVIKGLDRKEAIRDVVPCKEYFDKINALVEQSKDKDFVYWYISDEPECRGVSPIYLRHIYEHMKEIDPYHPLLTASRAGMRYIDCADWFETHPYLNPHDDGNGNRCYGRSPAEMGGFLDAFQPENHPDKCVGFLPTLFSYKSSLLNDYPTFDEYVCHTWAAMIHGGKSLFPYAYHDMGDRPALYEGNRYVFSSFAALENLVLNAKRTWLVKNDRVKCVRYDLGNEAMFVLVNLTQEPQTVSVPELQGDFREFRGKRTFSRAIAALGLKPLEVIIGTTEPHDEGLPTYAETKALIERLEAERLGRDNQLLGNYQDIVLSASKPIGESVKLFDGTRDVIAFYQSWNPETFIEISFPKGAKRFHIVRLFGRWDNDPVVSIRKNDNWLELAPVKILERTKDSIVYDFGECVRTVKMRITFSGNKGRMHVELYEIELGRDGEEIPAARTEGSIKPQDPLWLLDEKNAESSEKYGEKTWFCKPGTVTPREGGGYIIRGHASNLGVKVPPEAQWFTVRFEKFFSRKGYNAWSVYMDGTRNYLCGGVTHPQPGLYTIPLKPVEKTRSMQFVWYDYNFDLEFAYAALEKEPANYVLCRHSGGGDKVKEGDTLEVTVKLREPAEDLSAVFMCDHGGGGGQAPYAVNGTNAIILERTEETGRCWVGRVAVNSFKPTKHKVYVKVTALGGALDLPLFTTAPSFSDT